MEKEIFAKNLELKNKYLEEGPMVYELYGVMLHSGGAHGGHYSAYIKDF
jgi:ubiquitin carboxyl-terminal hydrolase 47